MRIVLDTNVYVSVFVLQSKRLGQMLNFIGLKHQIVMCSYVLDELTEVIAAINIERVGVKRQLK